MTHSYDVDIALAVGGIPEAIMLKEVAYWCKKNEAKGVNEQGGRYWTYNSIKEWQTSFPEFNAGGALQRLRKDGWLLAEKTSKNPWDHTLSYALSDKSISLLANIDLSESENRFADTDKSNSSGNNTSGKTTSIEEILKKNEAEINRLYALYPGKTETNTGSRSTGKCSKDKHRIAALLRTHTIAQIERSITMYLEEQGGRYLKNFSTFLNNLPEYEEESPAPPEQMDEYAHYQ